MSSSSSSTRKHGGSGAASDQVAAPEPSFSERARTLVYFGRIGSLSTLSRKQPGFPFGSVMPYALDASRRPIFLISTMAMHTQNLQADPRASLLVTQPDASGDPLGASRVTVMGTVLTIPDTEVADARGLYLERYANSKYWVHPDPLADAAAGIIEHMNADHKDALILLAMVFAGVESQEAAMTAVDRLGFQVRLKTQDGMRGVRIAFSREVSNPAETRKVFVEMVQQAPQEP